MSHCLFAPPPHDDCPSSCDPRLCMRALLRPVPVRRRSSLGQTRDASLELAVSDYLGLKESLCGEFWRWMDLSYVLL